MADSQILNLCQSIADALDTSGIVEAVSVAVMPDKDLDQLSSLFICVTPYSFSINLLDRDACSGIAEVSIIVASPATEADFPRLMGVTDGLAQTVLQVRIPNAILQAVEFKPVYDSESYLENGLYISVTRLKYKLLLAED